MTKAEAKAIYESSMRVIKALNQASRGMNDAEWEASPLKTADDEIGRIRDMANAELD